MNLLTEIHNIAIHDLAKHYINMGKKNLHTSLDFSPRQDRPSPLSRRAHKAKEVHSLI